MIYLFCAEYVIIYAIFFIAGYLTAIMPEIEIIIGGESNEKNIIFSVNDSSYFKHDICT
jgi:hypothetical protein